MIFNIIDIYVAGKKDEYYETNVGHKTDIKKGNKLS